MTENLQVGGWLKATHEVDVVAASTSSAIGLVVAGGAEISVSADRGNLSLKTAGTMLIGGRVETTGYAAAPVLATGGTLAQADASSAPAVYVGGRLFAQGSATLLLGSGEATSVASDLTIDVTGSIETIDGSVRAINGRHGTLDGPIVARDATADAELVGFDSLDVRGRIVAGQRLTLGANSAAAIGAMTTGAMTSDAAATGAVTVFATSMLESQTSVLIEGRSVDFRGLLTTTSATATTTDREIVVRATGTDASDSVQLSGQFDVAGSVGIESNRDVRMTDFVSIQSGAASGWSITADGDVLLGDVEQNPDGTYRSLAVRMQAARFFDVTSGGRFALSGGSRLAVSDAEGQFTATASDSVSLIGSIHGGASFNSAGQLIWTGRDASVS
ncbi:MAG TPA: hypothetical protein PLV92_03035, partial [Pirellulaceae bacterium]|nr:hypothetical protein [Pirellulaceae bacterium]